MSPRRYLPKSEGQAPYWCEYQPGSQSACWCVKAGAENSDPHSSLNYFRRYLDRIREIDPAKMPDFINQHLYPLIDCYEDSLETENLKEHIRSYRTVMKEKGLQNLDLIISEWGPLDRRITDSAAIGRFMSEMSDFFFRASDPALGLPADDYRLVQRWAWFVFTFSDSSTDPNNYPNLHLFDPISRQITQVGESYRQVAARYVSDFFCPVCPAGVLAKDQGNANCDAKINGLDFAWWAKGDPAADFNRQTGQISPIVDLADFYLWLVNYG
jgi:hypothetical protein